MRPNAVHAILAGPVKDPNRNRTVKHGALHVEGTSLRLQLNDGRHVRLTVEGPADLLELALQLALAASEATNGCYMDVVSGLQTAARCTRQVYRSVMGEPTK